MPDREFSDETAQAVDEEVRRLVDEAYTTARSTLKEKWEQVEAVAEALLRHETLTADDVQRLMQGEELAKPTVSDLLAAEANKKPQKRKPDTSTDEDEGPAPGLLPSPA